MSSALARRALPERSICFVAPTAWAALSGERSVRVLGGAEVQQSILGAEFARHGWRTSMICMDHGQADGQPVNGVAVHRCHAPSAGVPVLRFVHPRMTSIVSAMRRADAAIYYQRGGGALTGIVAGCARHLRRRFVFAAASDADFDPRLPMIPNARDRALYRWGIRRADLIVVQSERQLRHCGHELARPATLVRSAYRYDGPPARHGQAVLWAGTLREVKRPHLFVELARRLPHLRFVMVGGAHEGTGGAYARRVLEEARALPNLATPGFVPYAEIGRYFDEASVVVNTSVVEGFPNTFLQGWARAMPSVSFFDVGARRGGEAVGTICADLDELVAGVAALMDDHARWRAAGQRCREHFEAHHCAERVFRDYAAALGSIR